MTTCSPNSRNKVKYYHKTTRWRLTRLATAAMWSSAMFVWTPVFQRTIDRRLHHYHNLSCDLCHSPFIVNIFSSFLKFEISFLDLSVDFKKTISNNKSKCYSQPCDFDLRRLCAGLPRTSQICLFNNEKKMRMHFQLRYITQSFST